MEKNSKNNSDLSGEEKSDENSNKNSSEEKKMMAPKKVCSIHIHGVEVSFDLTISYLLKELDSTKSQDNLHGCPRRQLLKLFRTSTIAKDSSPEESIPRMIKWMVEHRYKTNIDPIYRQKNK
ncbi:hypothetical protein H5410_035996 [Solanum commersonii]|uniref:Uncharacterized protein n=1 Tax=Solanum commersonii TaxID=4109 RepID=A0A9J5Y699_SOLCO|nr:hypothetical protein H5410_035996 [Solanum commersonii]